MEKNRLAAECTVSPRQFANPIPQFFQYLVVFDTGVVFSPVDNVGEILTHRTGVGQADNTVIFRNEG